MWTSMTFVRRRAMHVLLSCGSLAALAIVIPLSGVHTRLASGLAQIDQASPPLLAAAGLVFATGFVCAGLGWRAGLRAAGTELTYADAASRYLTGSLVNALVPLRAGGAVRLALYASAARSARTVACVAAAIGSVRTAALATLVCIASATAPIPLWPSALLSVAALGAGALAVWLAGSLAGLRAVVGWTGCAVLARVAGATLVAAAFDAPAPLLAGVSIVAAVELAATLPLTPGNVALSSAAIAFVLAAEGLPGDVALAAGLSVALLETGASLVLGVCGVCYLTTIRARSTICTEPSGRGGLPERRRPWWDVRLDHLRRGAARVRALAAHASV
jgi:uncharacterized membrane protein YbhN (UPF0104 family)